MNEVDSQDEANECIGNVWVGILRGICRVEISWDDQEWSCKNSLEDQLKRIILKVLKLFT